MLLRCLGDCSSKLGSVLREDQTVPSWSAFNASVGDIPQRSTIGYLPVIPASPTELAAVHEAMLKSCAIAKYLNEEHVIITLDRLSTARPN